jgi:hypothetical protein
MKKYRQSSNHSRRKDSEMTTTNTSMAIIAIVAALGLLGVVIVDVMLAAQVASAVPPPTKGCRNSLAANASQGHCFRG